MIVGRRGGTFGAPVPHIAVEVSGLNAIIANNGC